MKLGYISFRLVTVNRLVCDAYGNKLLLLSPIVCSITLMNHLYHWIYEKIVLYDTIFLFKIR